MPHFLEQLLIDTACFNCLLILYKLFCSWLREQERGNLKSLGGTAPLITTCFKTGSRFLLISLCYSNTVIAYVPALIKLKVGSDSAHWGTMFIQVKLKLEYYTWLIIVPTLGILNTLICILPTWLITSDMIAHINCDMQEQVKADLFFVLTLHSIALSGVLVLRLVT